MTKEELKELLMKECITTDKEGKHVICKNVEELTEWIFRKFIPSPLYAGAFSGMLDKHGNPIHEGDRVRFYYKGEYVICRVIYDTKHAAFFIKWPDGYVNQYFMNGSSYEVLKDSNE